MVLQTYGQEDVNTHDEQSTLRDIIQAIGRREPPPETAKNGILQFLHIFERARNPADPTGTRERLMDWFGEDEAAEMIASLHFFFDEYWNMYRIASRLLPFSFGGSRQREEILRLLSRVLTEMSLRDESLAL